MPDAYEIHDGQFLQQKLYTSAADALFATIGPVPAGKIWTILSGYQSCSVAETQYVWWAISAFGVNYPVTLPVQQPIAPAVSQFLPLVREGMELKLFQNEYIKGYRAAATAGSTMTIYIRYIETDIQYYVELDKHKVLARRLRAMEASSPMRSGGLLGPSSRIPGERPTREPRER